MEVVTYEYLVYYQYCSDLNQGLTIARASETFSGKNPSTNFGQNPRILTEDFRAFILKNCSHVKAISFQHLNGLSLQLLPSKGL